jgi:uncharacterized membrane protein YbaN (DUF454 family)
LCEPPAVTCSDGTVRVWDPRIFGHDAPDACQRFLQRVFSVEEIQSITVDRADSTAWLRYAAGEQSAVTILSKLACSLQDQERFEPDDHPLRQLVQNSQHDALTIVRCGNVYSIWERPQRDLHAARPTAARGMRRLGYLSLAGGSFGMSVVGVVAPGIPTVPFLLLTSYFLVRSSPSLNRRLLRSRTFGQLLRDWHQHGGMRPKVKAWTLAVMVVVVVATVLLGDLPLPALIVVLVLVCVGFWTVWRIPTVPDDAPGRVGQAHEAAELPHDRPHWASRDLVPKLG